jgi:hypothetical protein
MSTSEEAAPAPLPRAVVKRVTDAFLIFSDDDLVRSLEPYSVGDSRREELTRDAVDGLKAVLHTATIPFTLTVDRVQYVRFDRIHSSERIRALKDAPPKGGLTPELEARAFQTAKDRMTEFLGSTEGINYTRDGVIYELARSLETPAIALAAAQLLAQALISTWSVFEVFISSFIIEAVNSCPNLAKQLSNAPDTKRHLGKPVVDIGAIDAHGFDLTNSMGTVLFSERRLDNLGVIRDLMDVIVPTEVVRNALRSQSLWMLNQRRHLFVHRRGLVDREYLGRTGDTASFGTRLTISSHDVEGYLRTVADAVFAVISSSSNGRGE